MKYSEPPRHWQGQQHQRILQKDPVAFSELCEAALSHLASALEKEFPNQEPHTCQTVAIDLLLSYQNRPEQYDPSKLSLFGYLRMGARGDMRNEINKQQRCAEHLADIDDPVVELEVGGRNTIWEDLELDEWLETHTDLSRHELLEILQTELDPADEQILLLMLEGVRETERYAEVMGISHWDELSRRREVKRAKDRLNKKVRRFRNQLGKS